MAEKKFSAYGLNQVSVASLLTDNETEVTYTAELTRCYAAQTSSVEVETTENSLRGDDGVVEISAIVSNVAFEIENAVLTFKQFEIIVGGTIEDIMEEAVKVGETYTLAGGTNLPYFGLLALVESNSSLKIILPKCKAVGGITFEFSDENYCVVSFSGSSIKRDFDGAMLKMKKYDAKSPLAVTDLV
jgi:hypothetical protein